ncbi:ABC transporter substrate-binding protein [Psychrobacter sp. FDAARGOS_221]|uniref:ABC transporter substrate-binding protein n=1 Tax=Psychrobacter sp. FDAARGOS_221 TaxID=1975705 RepID=UPI000BB572BE|nr:ABC transporter substrate-binding protein [Psychrobacter sp. FDAARGOS_221]PNK61087.1 ABC transporter substrate-binding protein [Psychrobacter sp. FDAARGOS_221]
MKLVTAGSEQQAQNTKSRGFKTAALLSTLALSVALTACGGQSEAEKAEGAEGNANSEAQTLTIATEGAYAPFNYTDSDGNLGGFDVDISNALCEQMQATCEIVSQDWEGIIPGLKAKKYDAIVAAMSVTPERAQQVDFTDPYFTNSLVFIATKDSDFDPTQEQMINGRKIAAQRSTISSQWLETTYPQADIQMYDTLNNAFLDLESGRVEAMISDKLPAIDWLSSNKDEFTIKGDDIEIDDNFAIAVRKEDPLKQQLNEALTAIKADGTYDAIKEKHFPAP